MKSAKLSTAMLFAVAGCVMAAGAAAQPRTDAYVLDPSGTIVKDPFGLCWRTSSWTADKAVRECDPALFPAPAAAVPAPAEPVAPVVAAPPAPVIIAPEPPAPPPPVAARVIDSDRDGVLDEADRCPGSSAGAKVDASGCEIVEAIVLKGVNFETNSARLTKDSLPVLDAAAQALLKRPKVSTEVAGYTDDRGAEKHNVALSQKRADTVREYLIAKGVPAGNLTSHGYGEEHPMADNKTAAGRAANRRVELRTK
jgi:outer membrane protein OmpA-like peptidoglycan-associated protein